MNAWATTRSLSHSPLPLQSSQLPTPIPRWWSILRILRPHPRRPTQLHLPGTFLLSPNRSLLRSRLARRPNDTTTARPSIRRWMGTTTATTTPPAPSARPTTPTNRRTWLLYTMRPMEACNRRSIQQRRPQRRIRPASEVSSWKWKFDGWFNVLMLALRSKTSPGQRSSRVARNSSPTSSSDHFSPAQSPRGNPGGVPGYICSSHRQVL